MAASLRTALCDPLAGDVRDPDPSAEAVAAARRQQQQLAEWFRDYFDSMWRLAARLGVPREAVDDVVQEAFITAAGRADDITEGCARAFLLSTTVRICSNQRRRQRTRAEYTAHLASEPGPDEPVDGERELAHKQLRSFLDVALDELPAEQRTVLVLHEIEGFSAAEIATLLGDPPGTVASRLGRARQRFSRAAARLRAEWQQHR